ncbi:MAG: cell division protein MraZ [Acidimicrobiales bacterium]|nr:cell division protein MraZ [Acidimicrobiales bacterium]
MEAQGGSGEVVAQAAATRSRGTVRHLPFADQFALKAEPSGRIVLPSTFRAAFAAGGYLRVHQNEFVGLWTVHDFARMDRDLLARRQPSLSANRARQMLYATAKAVRPDSQGRIIVPDDLRTRVGIDGDLVAVGAIDRVELWAPERWAAAAADVEAMLELELSTYAGPDPDDLLDLDPDDVS